MRCGILGQYGRGDGEFALRVAHSTLPRRCFRVSCGNAVSRPAPSAGIPALQSRASLSIVHPGRMRSRKPGIFWRRAVFWIATGGASVVLRQCGRATAVPSSIFASREPERSSPPPFALSERPESVALCGGRAPTRAPKSTFRRGISRRFVRGWMLPRIPPP